MLRAKFVESVFYIQSVPHDATDISGADFFFYVDTICYYKPFSYSYILYIYNPSNMLNLLRTTGIILLVGPIVKTCEVHLV